MSIWEGALYFIFLVIFGAFQQMGVKKFQIDSYGQYQCDVVL
jgi:hypothetical protein